MFKFCHQCNTHSKRRHTVLLAGVVKQYLWACKECGETVDDIIRKEAA